MDPLMGSISIFAGTFAPLGWYDCSGQSVSISQNQALYAIIGNIYGGNSTMFNLPDFRGRVAIGQGQGGGLQNYAMGQKGGFENVTLNVTQMPAHNHSLAGSFALQVSKNPGTHQIPAATNYLGAVTDPNGAEVWAYTATAGTTVALNGFSATGATIGAAGGGQPHSNLQPYTVLRYIIAWQGIFPQRP